jgi:hypothetical protein
LNTNWFLSLDDAKRKIDFTRIDFDQVIESGLAAVSFEVLFGLEKYLSLVLLN